MKKAFPATWNFRLTATVFHNKGQYRLKARALLDLPLPQSYV
jgi:hypothetical protein